MTKGFTSRPIYKNTKAGHYGDAFIIDEKQRCVNKRVEKL